jgi:predicted enzyme related to lactoylglutathione lyase
MDRAKTFYERVFDRTFQQLSFGGRDQPELWAFSGHPDGVGAPGALVKMTGCESGGNSVIVYFSSSDCGIEHARAVEAGGQSIKPKTPIPPFGFIALIRDPDGNQIGIHSIA